ncbi:hypothetical protein [Enterocloster sp.]|uniref:hypothetical protein n=1 Tax=Enterocloster sp. TaxID=2719315 RepID=UPI0039A0550A
MHRAGDGDHEDHLYPGQEAAKALKAIAANDYTFEYTLEDYLKEMSVPVSEGQREVLARRLKGDYKEDKKTLLSVLGYLGKGTTEEAAEAAAPTWTWTCTTYQRLKTQN